MSAAAPPPPVPTQESLGTAGPFDLDKCARLFAECSAAAHDVPVLPFLTACEEVKKLVASLGVILGFASVEITERVAGILARVKDLRLAAAAQGGATAPQTAAAAAAAAPAAARASSSAAAGGAGAAGAGPAEAVGVRETLQWLVEDEASRKGAVERGTSVSRRPCATLRAAIRAHRARPPAAAAAAAAAAAFSRARRARPRATSTASRGCWTSSRAC